MGSVINSGVRNGKPMNIDSSHEFESSFVGATACGLTTQALGLAVQNLINLFVTYPQFGDLAN